MVALRAAGLAVRPGEVHAVLEENGAGKTTLLRVLGGLQPPDRGDLSTDGRPARLRTPRDAWRHGIGLVHQHFTLVPRLTVLENFALGGRFTRTAHAACERDERGDARGVRRALYGGLQLPLARVAERAASLAEATGLAVPLDAPVETLSVGARQRIEILKVLLREPLALDEPTAVLAPAEVERLLALLRELAAAGRAVVIVAHKLDEVLAVADRVTVLREGRTVLEAPRADVDAAVLAAAMLGEEPGARPGARAPAIVRGEVDRPGAGGGARPSPPVAVLDRVALPGARGEPALVEASLEVHRGEIVGIAGVEGNGQRELALVLAGRARPATSTAELPDDPGFITQDRAHEGLIAEFDLAENVALALHRLPAWRRGPLLRWPELRVAAAELLARYRVRAHARFPAGTNSASSWPASWPAAASCSSRRTRRAGSTSRPPRSCTANSRGSGRREPRRSCSSRPTWTRCWRWPTAST